MLFHIVWGHLAGLQDSGSLQAPVKSNLIFVVVRAYIRNCDALPYGRGGGEPYQLYSLAVLQDSDPFYTKLQGPVVMMIMMGIPMPMVMNPMLTMLMMMMPMMMMLMIFSWIVIHSTCPMMIPMMIIMFPRIVMSSGDHDYCSVVNRRMF